MRNQNKLVVKKGWLLFTQI